MTAPHTPPTVEDLEREDDEDDYDLRPVVTEPPRRPKPLPQRSGPESGVAATGRDAAPMRWADSKPCGHRIPARVGRPFVATFIDPTAPPMISSIVTVEALPGECPVCDEAPGMAVRDT